MTDAADRLEGPGLTLLLDRLDKWRRQMDRRAVFYERWANYYRRLHYWLGLPATLLAAYAGASAFLNHEDWAGTIALVVGLLTALVTVLKPIDTFRKLQQDSKNCAKVAADAGALALRLRTYGDDGTAWDRFEELRARAAEFIDAMDSVPPRYVRKFEKEMREEEGGGSPDAAEAH